MKTLCLYQFILMLHVVFVTQAIAEDPATPYEVVQKVEAAVYHLEQKKGSVLSEFNEPAGPWVWKDTYLFIIDCSKLTVAAHPVTPALIGENLSELRDMNSKLFFQEFCQVRAEGAWVDYLWPKPGEQKASRKISYIKSVTGSPLRVGGGLYEKLLKVDELAEFTREMHQSGQIRSYPYDK